MTDNGLERLAYELSRDEIAGLGFSLRGGVLLREGEGVPLNEMHRRLAHWLDEYYDSNQGILERLYIGFRIATYAVLAEAMLWLFKLAL